jgi:hypothetical protein
VVWQVNSGVAIQCTKSEIKKGNGELLGETTLLFIIELSGCSFVGINVNSLGDASGVILVHYEGEACTIGTKPLVGGLLLKPLPLHLEIPAEGSLLLQEGSFVVGFGTENKSTREFKLKIEQKEGKPSIEGCLNAEGTKMTPETLTTSENGKSAVGTALEAKESVFFFEAAQEFMT